MVVGTGRIAQTVHIPLLEHPEVGNHLTPPWSVPEPRNVPARRGRDPLAETDPAKAIKARIDAFERAGDEIPYPQTVLDGTLPTDALVTALMPALCGSPNSTVCSSVLPGEELGPASAPGQHAQRHGQAGAGHGQGGDVDVAHQQASQQ